MGKPFSNDFFELIILDNRNCLPQTVSNDLYKMEDEGKKHYDAYVKTVLENRTSSIHEPIKNNSFALFKRPNSKATSTQGKNSKIKLLKNNVALCGQLYITDKGT